jgi:hypothetical protein
MNRIAPNQWQFEGRLLSFDADRLWDAFHAMCDPSNAYFPKPLDTVSWTVSTADHQKTQESPCAELPTIKHAIDQHAGNFHLRLFHKEVTPNLGLRKIETYFVDVAVDKSRNRFSFALSTVGSRNADQIWKHVAMAVHLIAGELRPHHKYLESYADKFFSDHPDYEKNVLLIMRFKDEKPFPEIVETIRQSCMQFSLTILRADDREYAADLWDNVLTYMYGCSSAIAVFDQVNYREFNPNVALEVGFMLAMGKPVLLLKDQAIEAMPSDIIGKIYRVFNTYDPRASIPPQIQKWVEDYRVGS